MQEAELGECQIPAVPRKLLSERQTNLYLEHFIIKHEILHNDYEHILTFSREG